MKPNLLKIIAAVICSIVSASAIHAQEKFSEYTEKPVNLGTLAAFADKFADRLAAEPLTTRGFVNVYDDTEEAAKIKSVLSANLDIGRITFYEPETKYAFDHTSNIEFWLIPKSTVIPYEPILICICPTISVEGQQSVINGQRLMFTASVQGGKKRETKTYNWKVSAGEIVEGQNTPVIRVDAKGAKEVTATVEIGGVCEECPREASYTSKISDELKLTDVIGLETECAVGAKLDVFLLSLANDPAAKGYIITYGGRAKTLADIRRRERLIRTYLMFRQVDTSRIEYLDGGNREHVASELWIAPDDQQKPAATPTVDKKSVGVSKAKKTPTRRKR